MDSDNEYTYDAMLKKELNFLEEKLRMNQTRKESE